MTTLLADLLKDSSYRIDQFKPQQIDLLESEISEKKRAGNRSLTLLASFAENRSNLLRKRRFVSSTFRFCVTTWANLLAASPLNTV